MAAHIDPAGAGLLGFHPLATALFALLPLGPSYGLARKIFKAKADSTKKEAERILGALKDELGRGAMGRGAMG